MYVLHHNKNIITGRDIRPYGLGATGKTTGNQSLPALPGRDPDKIEKRPAWLILFITLQA